MAHPLVLNIIELLRRPGADRSLAAQVPLADLDIADDHRFASDAEVDVVLRLEALSDGVVVEGQLHTPWHGTCRRCLRDTAGVVTSEVREVYQRTVTDPDAFELTSDQLDLRPLARELVLLDAPETPLCRPDCPGLCPTCGADLNEATCACTPAPKDDRWAALEALKGRLEN